LVPLDGSTLAEQAVAPAAAVAERHAASLHRAVVHPWGPAEDAPVAGTKPDRECREAEDAYRNQMMQAVSSTYRIITCETILDGAADLAPVEFARQRHVDLVVASTHGRGALGRSVLGSVVHHLMHALRASLLLIKPQKTPTRIPADGFERILLATNGPVQAAAALEPAAALVSSTSVITLFQVMGSCRSSMPPSA
jgi:nucleotide-binding universal stress UspA family protein